MVDKLAWYNEALEAFSVPHSRYSNIGKIAFRGCLAGLSADDVISDARAAGVENRDADIRSGWEWAKDRIATTNFIPAARPVFYSASKPPVKPQAKSKSKQERVKNLIKVGEGAGYRSIEDLRRLSPVHGKTWDENQTIQFLQSAFAPDDLLYVFSNKSPLTGKPGENMRTAAEWIRHFEHRRIFPGDIIVPNPFTGEPGKTTDGKESFSAASCLASYPYILLEFDALPLEKQCAFWAGIILQSSISKRLLSLTYSGNKSLHGLFFVGKSNRADWEKVRDLIKETFSASDETALCADKQAMTPRIGTRFPGVTRRDNGKTQELLYINPAVRPDSIFNRICPLRDPDAIDSTDRRRQPPMCVEETTARAVEKATTAEFALLEFLEREHGFYGVLPALIDKLNLSSPAAEKAKRLILGVSESCKPVWNGYTIRKCGRDHRGLLYLLREQVTLPARRTPPDIF